MKTPILDTTTKCLFKTLSERFGLITGVKNYVSLPNVKFAIKDALFIKDYFLRILGGVPYNLSGKKALQPMRIICFLKMKITKRD